MKRGARGVILSGVGSFGLRALILAMAVASASACSLLTSLDELQAGEDVCAVDCEGPKPGPRGDGSVDDAPTDVPNGGDTDGGSDAGPDSGGLGCSGFGPVTFCRDFDADGGVFYADFQRETRLGSLAANSAASTSPPQSLIAKAGPGGAGSTFAYMYRIFDGSNPTDIRLATDVQLEANAQGFATVLALSFGFEGPKQHGLFVNFGNVQSGAVEAQIVEEYTVAENLEYETTPFTGKNPTLGVWSHLELHVVIAGAVTRLTVTLDGQRVVDRELHSASWPPLPPEPILGVLDLSTNASSQWRVRYDNVVLDLH